MIRRNGPELTELQWQILNCYSDPDSPLRRRQLRLIDRLRQRYPPDSPARRDLNIFDPRTGLADRIVDMANEALQASHEGDEAKARRIMSNLPS